MTFLSYIYLLTLIGAALIAKINDRRHDPLHFEKDPTVLRCVNLQHRHLLLHRRVPCQQSLGRLSPPFGQNASQAQLNLEYPTPSAIYPQLTDIGFYLSHHDSPGRVS